MKNIYTPQRLTFVFYCLLSLFSFNVFAQVGIGTTDPKTTLDINGALSLREGAALSLGDNNNNNINLGVTVYSFYRITGSNNAFSIDGIVPVANADGQILVLQNTRGGSMTVKHESLSSTDVNRIYIPGEKDFLLPGKFTTITLQYNDLLGRWVLQNKLNSIETWYHTQNIVSGYNTCTATIPQATIGSSVSVNFLGPIDSSISNHFFMEYIEAKAGQVVFRIYNDSGNTYNNINFAITINKI